MQHIYNTNKAKIFDRSISVIAGITLIGVITYYNLLGSLHSLPITEGWFSAYAQLVLQGKVIYRDFYLYLTPLYVWIIALFTFIFGNSIFALHIFGIVMELIHLQFWVIYTSHIWKNSSNINATMAFKW